MGRQTSGQPGAGGDEEAVLTSPMGFNLPQGSFAANLGMMARRASAPHQVRANPETLTLTLKCMLCTGVGRATLMPLLPFQHVSACTLSSP